MMRRVAMLAVAIGLVMPDFVVPVRAQGHAPDAPPRIVPPPARTAPPPRLQTEPGDIWSEVRGWSEGTRRRGAPESTGEAAAPRPRRQAAPTEGSTAQRRRAATAESGPEEPAGRPRRRRPATEPPAQ